MPPFEPVLTRKGSQAEARLSGRARFVSARRCPKPLLTRGLLLGLCCRKLPDNHYSRKCWGFDTSSNRPGFCWLSLHLVGHDILSRVRRKPKICVKPYQDTSLGREVRVL